MSTECELCKGKGEYEQTYTVGCGFGSYQSMGRCDYCGGTGVRKPKEASASPAAAVPEGALPPLPKPWLDRGDADDWKQPHNVYQTAEIAEWRARAAVEADRAQRPGYLKASETDCRIFEKAAQALLDRALAHYRASNFTLQDECLQCVEVIRDLKHKATAMKHSSNQQESSMSEVIGNARNDLSLTATLTEYNLVHKALTLAMEICDAVPSRLHKSEDSQLANIGMLVNAQDDGAHGYALIRDALEALTRQMSFTHADDIAWGHFADATKAKMAEGREKGRGGWEDPQQCPTERLQLMLLEHLKKGDPVDVANFCMMLWTRGAPVAAVDLKAARQAVLEDAAVICDNFAKREMHPAECASAIRMMKDSIK